MGKSNKTKKFAKIKRTLNPNDKRIKQNQEKYKKLELKEKKENKIEKEFDIKEIEQNPVHLYFSYNTAIVPPYQILIDTNFINLSIQKKIDIFNGMMNCLLAKCIPIITDCVLSELEKFGTKYRLALKIIKDPRFKRFICDHKGNYADDCLVNICNQHKCFIVATCDRQLKTRLRKIPGTPILSIVNHKYSIERFADINN
jgi:U3 small nucleolar RNA-associated protein 24